MAFSSRKTLVLVHTRPVGRRWRPLESLVGIEEDRGGPFIDQLHGHYRLKHSGSDGYSQAAQSHVELFVQSGSVIWRWGGAETGPARTAGAALLSKLADARRG